MTCIELRSYFDGPVSSDSPNRNISVEVAEHVRTCEECNHFAREQSDLAGFLNLVRDATPRISPALDAVILANFRKRTERVPVSGTIALRRPPKLPSLWFWRAAIAAVILLAVMLPLAYRKNVTSYTPVQTVREIAPPVPIYTATSGLQKGAAPVSKSSLSRSSTRKTHARATQAAALVTPVSLPPEFNRLMYCDPLSCDGPMEVIRMQMPATVSMRPSAAQGAGVVFADVVIGSDGVARGIRFVQ